MTQTIHRRHLYGLHVASGIWLPMQVDADGILRSTATFDGTVSIGNISIVDIDTDNPASVVDNKLRVRELNLDVLLSTRATETTLGSVLSAILDVYDAVDTLELSIDNIEINTDELETKVTEVKTAVDTFKTAFDAEDFATQTTLLALLVEQQSSFHRSSRFRRVLKAEPDAGEEMRREETSDFDYAGLAADGTATSALAWDVVRFTKTSNVITRIQFREDIVWDDRASGWS